MDLQTSSLSDLSDNQIKFLHKKKLSDDQLQIALAVDSEARRQGVNPEFVWPMVYQESKFKQDAVSPKGAVGVMQLMGDTAKGLKVDPNDLGQNISGGISLLKELMQNPKIGNDPYKVLAGYNASTETRNKFYESGDLADLKDETIKHMYEVGKHFGGELPSVSISAAPKEDQVVEAAPATEENVYTGTPVTEFKESEGVTPAEAGAMSGLAGAGLGTIYTAKAPAVRMAQHIGLLPGGKPISANDAAQLVEKTMTANAPQKNLHGGEKWQKSLTGITTPGAQMDKASLDLAKGMQSAVGIQGAPGFTGGTITEGGIILSPQEAAAVQAKQAATQPKVRTPSLPSRVAGKIAASGPVMGGLSAYGAGYNLQDAYNKYMGKDTAGAVKSGIGALASAASLVPKAAPYAAPVASAIDAERRLQDKDYIGAGTSVLGAVAPYAAPFVFGPEVGIPVGIATALGAPIANELKDYLQRQR